ncbi:hypothetical protein FISHEDRAFT_59726, partial [Fistulina hepatica ATCC 64428]
AAKEASKDIVEEVDRADLNASRNRIEEGLLPCTSASVAGVVGICSKISMLTHRKSSPHEAKTLSSIKTALILKKETQSWSDLDSDSQDVWMPDTQSYASEDDTGQLLDSPIPLKCQVHDHIGDPASQFASEFEDARSPDFLKTRLSELDTWIDSVPRNHARKPPALVLKPADDEALRTRCAFLNSITVGLPDPSTPPADISPWSPKDPASPYDALEAKIKEYIEDPDEDDFNPFVSSQVMKTRWQICQEFKALRSWPPDKLRKLCNVDWHTDAEGWLTRPANLRLPRGEDSGFGESHTAVPVVEDSSSSTQIDYVHSSISQLEAAIWRGAPIKPTMRKHPPGMDPAQYKHLLSKGANMVRANPDAYLALVPLGGGLGFYKSDPGRRFSAAAEGACVAIAQTIGEDHSQIRVFLPQPKLVCDNFPSYAYPIAAILEGATSDTMDFLASRQIWAFSPDLAFIALHFNSDRCSWMAATYIGSAVRGEDDDEARFAALAAIKQALWCSAAFCRAVSMITAQKPSWVSLSPLQCMVRATGSMEVLRSEVTITRDTSPVAHYQLHACPITSDDSLQKLYIDTIRKEMRNIHIGFASLTSTFLFEPCRFCRSPTHSTYDCPLSSSPLWYGPTHADLPEEPELIARKAAIAAGARLLEDQGQSRGRGAHRGRGGRGGRCGHGGRAHGQ